MSSFVVVEQERQARNKTVIQSVIGCSGRLFIFQGQRVTSKAQTARLSRTSAKRRVKALKIDRPNTNKGQECIIISKYPGSWKEGRNL